MKCVKCGKRLKNNEKFCTYCGYYNDEGTDENWSPNATDEDLIEENWYDDDVDSKVDEDEAIIEPVKKEKKKKEKPVKEKPIKEEKPKKEKPVKEIKIKEDNEVYDQNERYIEAYIGEDYKLIKKSPFNIWAFLLNWMYFLYRKLYITGIIGLVVTALVAFFFTKYFVYFLVISLLIIGFGFNYYYVFIVKGKVNKILKDYEGSDSFSLEKICRELGGVNVIIALVIYLIFLIVIVLSIVKPSFNTSHNDKFFKENSENKANCTSLVRLIYQEEKTNTDKSTEALCKVNKNKKNYELYLKTTKDKKTVYVYYETNNDYIEYINSTESYETLSKKKNLTTEEQKQLSDIKMIISNYKTGREKSIEEDNQIKNKTNREEKIYYLFEYQEIIR